jgi:very-short-patch-repair endonuclease
MVDAHTPNPPRNGEGDHAKHGGGADTAAIGPSVSLRLPPPRSGEDRKRAKHRTVGASDENILFARQLRRKMSLPEVLLWNVLRTRPDGLKFRRQYPISGYVSDFACLACRLLIEVDGDNHSYGDRPERDASRDRALHALGYETLRIPAAEVLRNMQGVLAHILDRCSNRPHHHSVALNGPPPRSGEDL